MTKPQQRTSEGFTLGCSAVSLSEGVATYSISERYLMPSVAPSEQKPDLYAAATCTKVQPYRALPRSRLQRTFPVSSGALSIASSLRSGGGNFVRRGCGYFFFLEVFFATFLVAAFVVFFAFFAFLAMSSSIKTGSMNVRTPCIDMHTIETISQKQN